MANEPVVTDAMIDVAVKFNAKGSYLSHPGVRTYRGTYHGDSTEAWERDYLAAMLRAALAAGPAADDLLIKANAEIVRLTTALQVKTDRAEVLERTLAAARAAHDAEHPAEDGHDQVYPWDHQ